ncbi:hypothetical protein [Prochlorococcus marinus]|uniref:Paralytic/GBP/PSP peptide n=1 Tax=Prochlorococcus marinus (strain MIT 9303) TaxID=59922 RepID=A2C847_PROM3|nr:hypothetical protein [Prochlorococcus marinus]ABM77657.1 Hypothetical protein P9303_09061 [Prochlorococcus marinus str. MIT 9303]
MGSRLSKSTVSALLQAILVVLAGIAVISTPVAAESEDNCKEYQAYGGYRDANTSEGSGILIGRSFWCGWPLAAGVGFKTADYEVIVHSCLGKEFCDSVGLESGATYVQVNKDGINGNFKAKGVILEATDKRMKVKHLESGVVYSWVDGKEVKVPSPESPMKITGI